MFARRQLAAAACAAGLATSSVAGAIAAPTEDARERATSAKIAIVERPAKRFERSIERHLERVARRDRAQAGAGAQSQSPESLGVSQSTLDAIAACESGGDPAAVNGAGYYGKYQFDVGTWQSVGGSGNPAEASEAEQDYRAALLYSRAGSSPWPICGA